MGGSPAGESAQRISLLKDQVGYNERSSVERFNYRHKEEFGGRNEMVPDPAKVMMHLLFGVAALFTGQLIRLTEY